MKDQIKGGATLWARQTIESEIFYDKPDKWFKIWFYLVNRVSHKDTKKYKRGETFIFYDWICDDVKATKDQVKKCIGWLKGCGMVSTRRSTRGVWLKVCKYSYFQTIDNYYYKVKAPHKALEKHQRSTREAPRYNKNDKNDKNDKKKSISEQSSQKKEVNEILDIFYKTNPTLNWGNKTSRKSAADLIKRFGLEKTKQIATAAVLVQNEPYAPVITTPYQLKENLTKLKSFYDRKKKSSSSVDIIS